MKVVFEAEIIPVPKPRMTRADRWKRRPCVLRYWAFKDKMNILANKQNFQLSDHLFYNFIFPMPKSWNKKKKKEMILKPHTQKPDLDNCLKAVWDCLLEDDSGISAIGGATKSWGEKGCILICKRSLTLK